MNNEIDMLHNINPIFLGIKLFQNMFFFNNENNFSVLHILNLSSSFDFLLKQKINTKIQRAAKPKTLRFDLDNNSTILMPCHHHMSCNVLHGIRVHRDLFIITETLLISSALSRQSSAPLSEPIINNNKNGKFIRNKLYLFV